MRHWSGPFPTGPPRTVMGLRARLGTSGEASAELAILNMLSSALLQRAR